MKRLCALAIGVIGLASSLALSPTGALADPRMDSVVKTGKLRVGLFLAQYSKDPASGEYRGVGAHVVSLAVVRTLGQRLGVPVQFMGYGIPNEVVDCLKSGQCDLGIMGVDPTRAAEVDLSPAFMQFDFTHLVPGNSWIRKSTDADRPGIRISVIRGHASTMVLARMSKQAVFVEATTPDDAFALLRSGQADSFASARPTLVDYLPQLAGARLLEDGYGLNSVALAIPKGQSEQVAYIGQFLAELKRSGWLKRAIDDAGLRGFDVAP